jgi:alpha-galactosidase
VICKKLIALKDADIELSYSTDRREVLAGADHVVCTIGVGGRRAWEQDVFIPRKYGIYQPVGDTIGPGGISRAMRMVPAMVSIANDVAELCPKAMLFNYSNPMTVICMAVNRAAKTPIIGLCHGVAHGWQRIAQFMDFDPDDGVFTACGLNHMVFIYHMRHKGEDLFPRLIDKINTTPEDDCPICPLTADFVRTHKTYIASDDRHYAEFLPEVMAENAYFGKTLGVGDEPYAGTFSFEHTIAEGDRIYNEYIELAKSNDPLPEDFIKRSEGDHEQMVDIITAIEKDKPDIFYVNMPNNSAINKVPFDTVIERPALVSGSGIQPLQLPDFPSSLLPNTLRYAGIYELVVEAALKGDAALMCCAIKESSPRLNQSQASKLTDELLKAQKEYLPQYF